MRIVRIYAFAALWSVLQLFAGAASAAISFNFVSCGAGEVGKLQTCGEVYIQANSSSPTSFTLGNPFIEVYGTHAADYYWDPPVTTSSPKCTAGMSMSYAFGSGTRCYVGVLRYRPSTSGTSGSAYRAFTAAGAQVINSLQGSGVAVVTSPSSLNCSTTNPGTSSSCGTITFSLSDPGINGWANISIAPTLSNTTDFSISSTTCSVGTSLYWNGTTTPTSCTASVNFNPSSAGSKSSTLTLTAGSYVWTASIAGAGAGSLSMNSVNCGSSGVGASTACNATISVTANSGPVTLPSPAYTTSGNTSDFGTSAPASNACVSGGTLSAGSSCNLLTVSSFNPGGAGSRSVTVSVSPSVGTGTSNTISGTGTYGTATVSVGSVTCSTTVGLSTNCSGSATITATSGQVSLSATPVSLSGVNASEFTVGAGACASATLTNGTSCNIGTITFNPSAAGSRSVTITSVPSAGSASAASLTGTASAAGTANVSSVSCGSSGVGVSKACSGTIAVTASGGSIKLGTTVYSSSGATTQFTTAAPSTNVCAANQVLASGASCNLLTVSQFTPTVAGSFSLNVSVTPAVGVAGVGTVTGSSTNGNAVLDVSAVTCSGTVGITANCTGTATITASAGQIVLSATPVTLSGVNAAEFSIAPGSCAGASLTNGTSCNLGTISFTAGASGARSVTITPSKSTTSGTVTGATLTGTGAAAGAVNVTSVSCGSAGIGTTQACSGTLSLTANGGSVKLGSTPYAISGDTTQFTYATASTNVCAADQVLATGASCNVITISQFKPTVAGLRTLTVSATPASGTGASGSATGTGTYGSASVSSLACGTTGVGTTKACAGTISLTATNGSIVLAATPYTLSGSTGHFTYAAASTSACAAGQTLASGTSCDLITVSQFAPNSAGALTLTATVTPASGSTGTGTVTGTGLYGSLTLSVSGVSCSGTVGLSSNCSGSAVITATGGGVTLNATPVTLSGANAAEFSVAGGACASKSLQPNQSCNLGSITFNPTSSGTRSVTLTTSSNGTNTSAALTGSSANSGSAVVSSIDCGSAGVGLTKTCAGALSITASGGAVQLGATAFSVGGATSQFSYAAAISNACSANQILSSGQSCSIGTMSSFSPTAAGTQSFTISVNPAIGVAGSGTVTGTGVYGSLVPTPTSLSCGSTGAGLSTSCGTFKLTAQGGQVRLAAVPITNTNVTDFTVFGGGCTANLVLNDGQSCTSGAVNFNPKSVGALSGAAKAYTVEGAGPSIALSGTGLAGSASLSPTAVNCGTATVGSSVNCSSITVTATGGPITLSASPFSSSNARYSIGNGTCTASAALNVGESCTSGPITFSPNAAGALNATMTLNCGAGCSATATVTGTGYSYSWQSDTWASCTGGSGTWQLSAYSPVNGCGITEQTRTASCEADTNSATQSRAVSCMRFDGVNSVAVSDLLCDSSSKPSTSQSCTPTTGYSCGTQPPLTQSVLLTNTCAYAWKASAWSAWSSTCSETANRTRVVECERSDDAIATDENCAAPKPVESETEEVLTSCTYSWVEGGFGACMGGSYVWLSGSWSPSVGCGEVTQTRQVTCAVDSHSGSHSQTLICQRSDGTNVLANMCDSATRPSEIESCTPNLSICENPPSESQVVHMDSSCVRDSIVSSCKTTEQKPFCVAIPL